jgi:lysophospholipase L1-like esterase
MLQIKNASLVCGITIILLCSIELMSYVLVSIRYALASPESLIDPRSRADGYMNADWAKEYFKELSSMPGYKWHSYFYWRRAPFKGKYTNIDEEGLRQTWNSLDHQGAAETKRLRIFMFGGSTLWGTGARDDETIPSFVAKMLTQEYGFNVKVINFGVGGHITTQEIIALLRELQRGNIPDFVVFYDGANDAFSTFQNRGMAGIPQNEFNREREFNLLQPGRLRRLYKETLLVTYTNSSTYQVVNSLARRMTGRELLRVEWNPSVYPPPYQVAHEVVRVYNWNITFVKNLGQIYGFKTLFYWQPVVFTKDKLTSYEQEVANKANGMGQYYEAAATAAKTQLSGIDVFHDISDVFRGDPKPYFIDTVHITGAGNELVARWILKDIIPIVQQ